MNTMNILKTKSKEIEEKMEKISPVIEHSLQVKKLALLIFDQLKNIHKMKEYEKFLLGSAAMLHDIGLSKQVKNHHKISQKMIRKIPFKLVNKHDILLIGNIARYHRKACPNKKHSTYISLNEKDKNIVRKLSSIIRIADGLDRNHINNVENIQIEKKDNRFIFHIKWKNKVSKIDMFGFNKKKNLFEQEFGQADILTML